MGLLSQGSPLSWEETRRYAEHVRRHGILQFLHIYRALRDRHKDVLKWGDEVGESPAGAASAAPRVAQVPLGPGRGARSGPGRSAAVARRVGTLRAARRRFVYRAPAASRCAARLPRCFRSSETLQQL